MQKRRRRRRKKKRRGKAVGGEEEKRKDSLKFLTSVLAETYIHKHTRPRVFCFTIPRVCT